MTTRRRSPRHQHPARRWWLLGAIVVFIGLVAYVAWSAIATRSDLLAARTNAAQLQDALSQADSPGAQRALAALQSDFSGAHGRTNGPIWAVGSRFPWIGDDLNAVRTVAAVGDDLSHGTLAELVDLSDSQLADRMLPRQGRVDISAVESLEPVIGRAHRNLNEAAGTAHAADSDSLTRWVRPSYDSFASTLDRADEAFNAADRAVRALPTMLGKDGRRTYLLLFDNNAEIRSTGGLPGAYGVITADDGRIELTRQGAGGDIREFPAPVLPQSAAEKELYADQIARYFVDTNFTPEFPRTAELVRTMWQRNAGQKVDGVLSVDTVSLSYLLGATGPVTAPGGKRLTAQNATADLLNGIYQREPNPAVQNEYFTKVARSVFDKVTTGVDSPGALVSALGRGAREGRIYVHDFDPAVQRTLAGSGVAGELDGGDPRVPQVGVYLNDATGSKMSYYLRSKVRLEAQSCAQGLQQLQGTADLTYTKDSPPVDQLSDYVTGAGTYGTPRGEQLVLVRIYGPKGGDLSGFRVAGEPTPLDTVDDRGRPVATTTVQLRRGETVRVSWRVRSAKGQDRPTRLSVTPGMDARDAVSDVPATCD